LLSCSNVDTCIKLRGTLDAVHIGLYIKVNSVFQQYHGNIGYIDEIDDYLLLQSSIMEYNTKQQITRPFVKLRLTEVAYKAYFI